MPHLGEFTKKTHSELSAEADLHTPKLHASRHEGGADPLTLTSIDSLACKIKTGEYTGDNEATQAITGLGIQPKWIIIYKQTTDVSWYVARKCDQDGLYAVIVAYNASGKYEVDQIISMDADGFTVGDGTGGSAGNWCNADSQVYSYIAWT